MNTKPVFFDSAEYIDRFASSSYSQAILSGHFPLHIGYPALLWPATQAARIFHVDQIFVLLCAQVILAYLSLLLIADIVLILTKQRHTAYFAAALFSLVPIFWISNVTVMIESTAVFFMLLSLWLIFQAVIKNNIVLCIGACLFFILGYLTQPLMLFWLPFLLATPVCIYQQRFFRHKIFWLLAITLPLSFAIASLLNAVVIQISIQGTFQTAWFYLYTSKIREQGIFSLSLKGIAVYLRNALQPLVTTNTSALAIAGLISTTYLLKRKFWIGVWLCMGIIPLFTVNQWWDSLLVGRHTLLTSFCFCVAAALVCTKPWMKFCLLLLVAVPALYAVSLLRSTIPYLDEAARISQLEPNGLVVESHFARPQTQTQYRGTMIFVNEPEWPISSLAAQMKEAIRLGKPVYVTAAALSEPYGLYSGPYVHPMTLSYAHPYQLSGILSQFSVKEVAMDVYQIQAAAPSPYPHIPRLNNSTRRMDYLDPLAIILLVGLGQ